MAPRTGGYRVWSDEETQRLRSMTADGVPFPEQARRLGREVTSVRQKAAALGITMKDGAAKRANEALPAAEREVVGGLSLQPQSVEDIVRLFKIDLNVWEATHVTPVVWQMGAKHPETGELLKQNLYRTKVAFKRIVSVALEQLRVNLLADIAKDTKHRTKSRPAYKSKGQRGVGSYLLELDLFDLHLGKYAWGEETGHDYDSAIADRIARAAVMDLIDQARQYKISQVILPFGNDFFHTDTQQGTTTAGTQVDHDTRFAKMFRTGRALGAWMIEACAEIAPVHVPVVPGNHDEQAAFCMGVVLEAEFARDKRVTFDNSPRPRKYYPFGGMLLGFTHGKEEPTGKLGALMAIEAREHWAVSTCREFHIGHLHTGKKAEPLSVDEQTGVTVRWIRSLSGTDSWHAKKGFIGNQRNAEAFVWRREGGMRAHFHSLPV